MPQPLISIIIPSYNRAAIITETLDSVLAQTYSNWECIVVDDGSTDETTAILKSYLEKDFRFQYFTRPTQKTKGPSSSRNHGLEKAKGEYIIFLDSDDLLASFCLEERFKIVEKNEDCDFLVFQMEVFKTEKPDYSKRIKAFSLTREECLQSFIHLHSEWQITAPIYKKNFIDRIGGFNEGLMIFEDLELATRTIIEANKFQVFENIDCYYRNDNAYFEKQKQFDFVKKIIQSFEKYVEVFHNDVVLKSADKEHIKQFKKSTVTNYKRIFSLYIVQFTPEFFKYNTSILNFLIEKNYLSFTEKIKFLIVKNGLLKFHKFKGYGLFRIISYLMR